MDLQGFILIILNETMKKLRDIIINEIAVAIPAPKIPYFGIKIKFKTILIKAPMEVINDIVFVLS